MQRLGALCLTFALCATLGACGSSSSNSTTTNTTAAGGGVSGSSNAAALVGARLTAAKCLRGQGLNVPDPTAQRGTALKMLSAIASYPAVKVEAAERACATQLRQAFPNAASQTPAERARRLQELEAFATCMRAHGLSSYPDPSAYATNPAGLLKAIASVDRASPAYKSAAPSCRKQALKDTGG